MDKISIREEGLVATLFLPTCKRPLPAVVILSGSGGGLSESRAELLAAQGYAALALAYFNAEHLPATLKKIPLEYFETAFQWLKTRPEIDPERIGLWGISRGGELSLLLGSMFPEQIQAIAACVPSSVVYGAIDDFNAPAWTYQGKPVLPNAPFVGQLTPGLGQDSEAAIALTPCFLLGMEDRAAYEAAAIPVENIQCPILLISGEDDQMWPSHLFCQQIVDRLDSHSTTCTHISYPGAGHALSPTHKSTGRSAELHPVAKLWFEFGGNPKDDAFARQDSWEKTLRFFQENL